MSLPKIELEDGTPVTQANAAITNDPDPLVRIGVDLYQRKSAGKQDPRNAEGGSLKVLYCRAGKTLRKSELDLILTDDVV